MKSPEFEIGDIVEIRITRTVWDCYDSKDAPHNVEIGTLGVIIEMSGPHSTFIRDGPYYTFRVEIGFGWCWFMGDELMKKNQENQT